VQRLTGFGKKVLPARFVHWYRRRRATRRYMQALGYEVYDRQVRMDLEDIEGRVIARREGFQEQVLKDVLARTDLVLQELDRKIEGVSTRHGKELRGLAAEVQSLKDQIERLTATGWPSDSPPVEATLDVARTSPATDAEQ
jgi:hypothetical protein